MASVLDIVNLALANIGDDATVSSIDPPEGSAQAEHCARFYPMARDALLAMHPWNFATARISGAELTPEATSWQYAYAKPSECFEIISVLPPNSLDDYTNPPAPSTTMLSDGSIYTPVSYQQKQTQSFVLETLTSGTEVVYTNQEQAVIRYTKRVTDTTKFPPLFVTALTWLLSSYIAGPIYKGEVGRRESEACLKVFNYWFQLARGKDAVQRSLDTQPTPSSISARQ